MGNNVVVMVGKMHEKGSCESTDSSQTYCALDHGSGFSHEEPLLLVMDLGFIPFSF